MGRLESGIKRDRREGGYVGSCGRGLPRGMVHARTVAPLILSGQLIFDLCFPADPGSLFFDHVTDARSSSGCGLVGCV
jgi:hypothetical protein